MGSKFTIDKKNENSSNANNTDTETLTSLNKSLDSDIKGLSYSKNYNERSKRRVNYQSNLDFGPIQHKYSKIRRRSTTRRIRHRRHKLAQIMKINNEDVNNTLDNQLLSVNTYLEENQDYNNNIESNFIIDNSNDQYNYIQEFHEQKNEGGRQTKEDVSIVSLNDSEEPEVRRSDILIYPDEYTDEENEMPNYLLFSSESEEELFEETVDIENVEVDETLIDKNFVEKPLFEETIKPKKKQINKNKYKSSIQTSKPQKSNGGDTNQEISKNHKILLIDSAKTADNLSSNVVKLSTVQNSASNQILKYISNTTLNESNNDSNYLKENYAFPTNLPILEVPEINLEDEENNTNSFFVNQKESNKSSISFYIPEHKTTSTQNFTMDFDKNNSTTEIIYTDPEDQNLIDNRLIVNSTPPNYFNPSGDTPIRNSHLPPVIPSKIPFSSIFPGVRSIPFLHKENDNKLPNFPIRKPFFIGKDISKERVKMLRRSKGGLLTLMEKHGIVATQRDLIRMEKEKGNKEEKSNFLGENGEIFAIPILTEKPTSPMRFLVAKSPDSFEFPPIRHPNSKLSVGNHLPSLSDIFNENLEFTNKVEYIPYDKNLGIIGSIEDKSIEEDLRKCTTSNILNILDNYDLREITSSVSNSLSQFIIYLNIKDVTQEGYEIILERVKRILDHISITYKGFSIYSLVKELDYTEEMANHERDERIIQTNINDDILDYCARDFPACKSINNLDSIIASLNQTHKKNTDLNFYSTSTIDEPTCESEDVCTDEDINHSNITIPATSKPDDYLKQMRDFVSFICLAPYHYLLEFQIDMESYKKSSEEAEYNNAKAIAKR